MSKLTIFSIVWTMVLAINPGSVQAAEMSNMRIWTTRATTGQTIDMYIRFKLTTTTLAANDFVDIDFTNTNNDTFATNATSNWSNSDFALYRGGTNYVSAGANDGLAADGTALTEVGTFNIANGTTLTSPTCASTAANEVAFAAAMNAGANPKFRIFWCGVPTAEDDYTFVIHGTTEGSDGTGTFTTPSSLASGNVNGQGNQIVELSSGGALTDTGKAAVGFASNDTTGNVTATVNPVLTFSVGVDATKCTATSSITAGAAVSLGVLDPSKQNGAGFICTRLTTNATAGAVVYYKSINGALVSTRVGTDKLPGTAYGTGASSAVTPTVGAVVPANTEVYGLCVDTVEDTDYGKSTTVPAGGTITVDAIVSDAGCSTTATGTAYAVGTLTTGYSPAWSVNDTVSNAYVNMVVSTSLAQTTPSHNDYTDTIRFIAAGTF